MKRNIGNVGDMDYVSPELNCAEISVEKGFAQSGYDFTFDAPDYEDGLTL